MKRMILVAAIAALAACNDREAAPVAENNAATTQADAAATQADAIPAAMSLNETSWTFTREGKEYQESIDASGNYIANSGDEHADHGSYALVDGKHCFTSAMTEEGQVCWTAPANIGVGESVEITSDKGEKLTVTRVEYQPLSMPS